MKSRFAAVLMTALVVLGCRGAQLGSDQAEMRETLLDLYRDQVIDNLVRIRNNLPIIHVDYSKLTGTVTQTVGADGSATNTQARTGYTLLPGQNPVQNSAFQTRRVHTDVYGVKISGSQQNQLTVTGDPVINNNDVYDAYLAFMTDQARLVGPSTRTALDEALKKGRDDPGYPHVVHKFAGDYYWVPKRYAFDFFQLALKTTAMRGQAVLRPRAFQVTVLGVASDIPAATQPGKPPVHRLRLQLKSKIPNDSGTLSVFIKGERHEFLLEPVSTVDGKPVKLNEMVEVIDLVFDAAEYPTLDLADLKAALKDAEVLITLTHRQPGATKTDDLLQEIQHQLELQRLNQLSR